MKSTKAQRHEGTKAERIRAAGASPRAQRIPHVTGLVPGALTAALLIVSSSACVRRTITITTEPPNARVFLNDQEVGRSAVTTDFLWYGDYGVTIRKEGFETLQTNWVIKPPWYQRVPLDFFAEVLWPGQLHDSHAQHYVLEPAKTPTQEELIGRAVETRDRALDARK